MASLESPLLIEMAAASASSMVEVESSFSISQKVSFCASNDEVWVSGAEDACSLALKAAERSVGVPGRPPHGLC
jgi:hypothetical protein